MISPGPRGRGSEVATGSDGLDRRLDGRRIGDRCPNVIGPVPRRRRPRAARRRPRASSVQSRTRRRPRQDGRVIDQFAAGGTRGARGRHRDDRGRQSSARPRPRQTTTPTSRTGCHEGRRAQRRPLERARGLAALGRRRSPTGCEAAGHEVVRGADRPRRALDADGGAVDARARRRACSAPTSPSRSCTGPSARTAPSRACSSASTSPTSAPTSSPRRSAWTS